MPAIGPECSRGFATVLALGGQCPGLEGTRSLWAILIVRGRKLNSSSAKKSVFLHS